MRKQKGFSLIELLIVVAIILIIAAIAIPNLLRARMSANDSGAASTIRTINTSEVTYTTSYPTVGFSQSLTALGPNGLNCATTSPTSASACLLDGTVGCGTANGPCPKSGYAFFLTGVAPTTTGSPNSDYAASAGPLGWNTTGTAVWCSGPDAVVRKSIQGKFTATITTPETSANCVDPAGNFAPAQ